ncbi:MAG: sporulation integral membrane protein YtvI [Clostridia bacterium]|nr:sporulation integral membrane protein YtvI [Clostridia bacterium]
MIIKQDKDTLIRYLLIAAIILVTGAAFVLFFDKVIPQIGALFRFVGVLLLPFAIAWLAAVITRPFNQFMIKRLRMPPSLAILLMMLLFFGIIALLVILVISVLAHLLSAIAVYASGLEQLPHQAMAFLGDVYTRLDLDSSQVNEYLSRYQEQIVRWASQGLSLLFSVVKGTPAALLLVFVSLVAVFYWCRDEAKVRNVICSVLPLKYRQRGFDTYDRFSTVIGQYIRAQLILITISFVLCTIGFAIIGAERPFAMGLFTGVLDIIPVLGPGSLIVPWAIWALASGKIGFGVGLIIIYAIVSGARYILEPKIVGDRVGLHPLAALAAIFIGLKMFGLAGLILGPITLAVIMAAWRARKQRLILQPKQNRDKA